MAFIDARLDDPVKGPEFSVRVLHRLTQYGCETMRDVKERLDAGALEHIKGLGRRSITEIKEMVTYYVQLDNPQQDLLENPDEIRYRMENYLGSITSLMHDVQNTLIRAALKGRISPDSRAHVALKLRDAADYAEKLPTFSI